MSKKSPQKIEIILASSSIIRKKLLENIGLNFKIVASNYEEDMDLHESPSHLVKKLSLGKALDVAQKYPNSIVIGADTIAYIAIARTKNRPTSSQNNNPAKLVKQNSSSNKIISVPIPVRQKLGKPHTKKEATKMLQEISGKVIKIYTGFTIIQKNKNLLHTDYEVAKVKIKKLTAQEIQNYLKTDEPLKAAGALVIEQKGSLLVEKISGDYNAIMGLPLFKLNQALKKFGVEII